MKEFIDKLIAKLEDFKWNIHGDNSLTELGRKVGYEQAIEIVNALAEEHKDGWIPFTTDSELPKEGHRCWLSFSNPITSYVKSAWYIEGHFEWNNGRRVKDIPLAWKPYDVPEPYQPEGVCKDAAI